MARGLASLRRPNTTKYSPGSPKFPRGLRYPGRYLPFLTGCPSCLEIQRPGQAAINQFQKPKERDIYFASRTKTRNPQHEFCTVGSGCSCSTGAPIQFGVSGNYQLLINRPGPQRRSRTCPAALGVPRVTRPGLRRLYEECLGLGGRSRGRGRRCGRGRGSGRGGG